MDKTKYIEEAKSYIAIMKDDIDGTMDLLKESASLRLPLAQKWLELLASDEITITAVEHLAERAFNIESIDKRFGSIGSHLLYYISNWAEEANMKTTKMRSWKEKLHFSDNQFRQENSFAQVSNFVF